MNEQVGKDREGGRPRAGINTDRRHWEYLFSPNTRAALHDLLAINEDLIPRDSNDENAVAESVRGAEAIISAWGAHPFTPAVLSGCPDLKLIVYAGGSIRHLITNHLREHDPTVCTAVHMNARPVAEFTLGIILASLKDVFTWDERLKRAGPAAWRREEETFTGGYYGTNVGLLGYGRVTEYLIRLLAPFDFNVFLQDRHLSRADARRLGVRLAGVDEIMSQCDVVSLHHAATEENRHLINERNLSLMKPGARLINTARGSLIHEDALAERLRTGELTAYLDVTDPEPPRPGHPFYELPNCILTPHVAGSLGREACRLGDYCLREVENWLAGRPLENSVDLSELDERA